MNAKAAAATSLPHNFLGQDLDGDLVAPVDGPEDVDVRHAGGADPRVNRHLDPGWHRNGTHAPVLPEEVHNAPAAVPLL